MVNFRTSFFGKKNKGAEQESSRSGLNRPRSRTQASSPPVQPLPLRQTPAQIRAALGTPRRPRPSTIAGAPEGYITIFPPDPLRVTIPPPGYLAEVERDNERQQAQNALEGSGGSADNHQDERSVSAEASQMEPGVKSGSVVRDSDSAGSGLHDTQKTAHDRERRAQGAYPATTSEGARVYNISNIPQIPRTTAQLERRGDIQGRVPDFSRPAQRDSLTRMPLDTHSLYGFGTDMRALSTIVTSADLFMHGEGLPAPYGRTPSGTPTHPDVPESQSERPDTLGTSRTGNRYRNRHGSGSSGTYPPPARTSSLKQRKLMGKHPYETPGNAENPTNLYNASALRSPLGRVRTLNAETQSATRGASPLGGVESRAGRNDLAQSGEARQCIVPPGFAQGTPQRSNRAQGQGGHSSSNPFLTPATQLSSHILSHPSTGYEGDPRIDGSASTVMLREGQSVDPFLTPNNYRWVDGGNDGDLVAGNAADSASVGEALPPPRSNDPRYLIHEDDDGEDMYSVGIPRTSMPEHRVGASVMRSAAAGLEGSNPSAPSNESEHAHDNEWVDMADETNHPGPSSSEPTYPLPHTPVRGRPVVLTESPSRNPITPSGSYVKAATGGPRRGSRGVQPSSTSIRSPTNSPQKNVSFAGSADPKRASGVVSSHPAAKSKKSAKFAIGSKIKSLTTSWLGGDGGNKKRLSVINSGGSRRASVTGPAIGTTEEALTLSSLGYIAPLGSNLGGEEIPHAQEQGLHGGVDSSTARLEGQGKMSRLKKLKSLASLSNLAAAFRREDHPATNQQPNRNLVISAPVPTTGDPNMIAQANRVREQMLEAMGGFEGVSLASSRYAGTMPGTTLGAGAICVDPQGLAEIDGSTYTPIAPPENIDPHEGRGHEGIWSGPGIAVSTPEGGIRVLEEVAAHTEEDSPTLYPHPGVRFHIPDDAVVPLPPPLEPMPRGRPTTRQAGLSGFETGSGWAYDTSSTAGARRGVSARSADIPPAEEGKIWNVLRKANSRFFGRNKKDIGAPQPPSRTGPPLREPREISQVAQQEFPAAIGNSMMSAIPSGASCGSEPVNPQSCSVGALGSSANPTESHGPVEAGVGQELQNPLVATDPTASSANPVQEKESDEAIAECAGGNQSDGNWTDTESAVTDDHPETSQNRQDQSSSDSDSKNVESHRKGSESCSVIDGNDRAPVRPPPTTPLHRRVTSDRLNYQERMFAVRRKEKEKEKSEISDGKKRGGVVRRGLQQEQGMDEENRNENARPQGGMHAHDVDAMTEQNVRGRQMMTSSRSRGQEEPFVVGLPEDPFYDADLEDAMRTASRQLATESLYSTNNSMFANTQNKLLRAFGGESSMHTPPPSAAQQALTPFSQASTPANGSQIVPTQTGRYGLQRQRVIETQRALLAAQEPSEPPAFLARQSRAEMEQVARRVRENRFRVENQRRFLAGQPPLQSLEEQERIAPRSGPSPPPAFRAGRLERSGVVLRGVGVQGIPSSPTPRGAGGQGRVSLVDSDDEE